GQGGPISAEELAWLEDPERLRRGLQSVISPVLQQQFAKESLKTQILPPESRAALARIAGERDQEREAWLMIARPGASVSAWREVLRLLPDSDDRWAILDEALAALANADDRAAEEEALRARLAGPCEPGPYPDLQRRLG